MLKKLRNKKTAKKIWITLCILILPAFVFWGLGGALRSQKEPSVAKLGNLKISSLEYQDALAAVKNQAIIQFGDKFSLIQPQLNLESQALERLILLNEAKQRKLHATDKEVVELIENYPFFKNSKNQFDKGIYSQMLQYVFRTQPRIFEEETRQNIMLFKLFNTVTDKVTLSDDETKEEYRKTNEEISIDYIASSPADFIKDLKEPGEEEIKDYFTKNSLTFKEPLTFNLDYIRIEDKEILKKIIPRLNRKDNFSKVGGDFSLEVKETGPLTQTDPIPGIGWSKEIFNLISKAKTGEIIPPVEVDKYTYIFRLKEKKDPGIPDLEKIKDKVKKTFLEELQKKMAKEKIEAALVQLKENTDFKKIAKDLGLKTETTAPFKYGSYIEGIGASDNFWLGAVGLKEGETSKIINETGTIYVIKLKTRVAPDETKFLKEKEEFAQKALLEKKQGYFIEFVEGLKKKAGLI